MSRIREFLRVACLFCAVVVLPVMLGIVIAWDDDGPRIPACTRCGQAVRQLEPGQEQAPHAPGERPAPGAVTVTVYRLVSHNCPADGKR